MHFPIDYFQHLSIAQFTSLRTLAFEESSLCAITFLPQITSVEDVFRDRVQ